MATYFTLLTSLGEAKLAAAQVTGSPVVLAALAVGDCNGAAYNPTAGQTALVRELARVTLEGVEIDPLSPTQFRVRAIVPASVGGFTVREIGLYDDDADLIAVGKFPEFYKPQPSDGFSSDLLLTMVVAYSGTPLVTIVVDDSQVYATREWVLGGRHFFAVKSATTGVPPSSPVVGDHFLIPTSGASGAWAAKGGKIAIWRGILDGWQYATPLMGAVASAADTSIRYVLLASVWTPIVETRRLTAAGGPNVWTGASAPPIATLTDGLELLASFAATNTVAAATLNIDGTGAKPIVLAADDATAIPPGTLPASARFVYRAGGGGKWVLLNPLASGHYGPMTDIGSAATVDLGSIASHFARITGATAITSLGNSAKPASPAYRTLFAGSLTLTNGASLILPGGKDITTSPGDTADWVIEAGNVWRCVDYRRAAGVHPGGFGLMTDIASAATVDLGSVASHYARITGATAITSFGASALTDDPAYRTLFAGSLTLTHGASLILPGGKDIRTSPGDTADWVIEAGNVWRCVDYRRAAGVHPGGLGVVTDIASAATVDLGSVASHYARITGATAITSFGATALTDDPIYYVRFAGSLTLAHGASLILPKAANIQAADGDFAIMEYLGAGNWRCVSYAKASGQALAGGRAPDAILMDRRASGTNGQTVGWTGFITRELNTVAKDPGGIVTNYGGTFQLPAGTYMIRAIFLTNQYAYTDKTVVYLYSGATGATLGWSTNGYGVSGGYREQMRVDLTCEFTISYAQSLRFDQWISPDNGVSGPGGWVGLPVALANGIAGAPETYAIVEIYKES